MVKFDQLFGADHGTGKVSHNFGSDQTEKSETG